MVWFNSARKNDRLIALHIDDSKWVRIPVSVILRRHFGMKVMEANSGPEGIALARQERPDVIILDVMMPQMDGFDTLVQLKDAEKTRDIPVLMCTARDEVRGVNMALKLGAVGYITKPIEEETLIEKVEEILIAAGKWEHGRTLPNGVPQTAPDQSDLIRGSNAETPAAAPRATTPPVTPTPPPPAPTLRACRLCQGGLSFIPQYDAWYCYACRKYPDLEAA